MLLRIGFIIFTGVYFTALGWTIFVEASISKSSLKEPSISLGE
jgi:hypothetical protein